METGTRINVLMLPWLAHGHISPFFELAKKLCRRNFFVYMCSTPVCLESIKNELNVSEFSNFIKPVEINLPHLSDLPPNYHTTNLLPQHLLPTLKKAYDFAQPTFSSILDSLKPDLLIYDFVQTWAPQEAKVRGIPSVLFLTSGAFVCSFFLDLKKNSNADHPAKIFSFLETEFQMYKKIKENEQAGDENDEERFLVTFDRSWDFVLIRSCRDIEAKYIHHFFQLMGKEIVPTGILVENDSTIENEDSDSEIIQWMNKKEKSSVVFVSFGTECFLSDKEIEEMAYGLEFSKINFIWVLRFPKGDTNNIYQEVFPKEFMEKVNDRGFIVNWAPQKRILQHPSIGGFLTHCGWGSLMEGLRYGTPLIALPKQFDQPINAKFALSLGVGLEILKREDGGFDGKEVANVIREVVVEKGGEIIRKRSKEISRMLSEKGDEEMALLVKKLLSLCNEKTS